MVRWRWRLGLLTHNDGFHQHCRFSNGAKNSITFHDGCVAHAWLMTGLHTQPSGLGGAGVKPMAMWGTGGRAASFIARISP